MGRPPLTDEEREDARSRITAAALELYSKGGLKAATMRAIAKKLGVAPSWLYLHYSSRYDLLTAVWRDALAETLSQLRKRARAETDPVARLRLLLQGYADFALANPTIFQSAFMIIERADDMPEPRPKSAMAPYVSLIEAAIEDAKKEGRAPDRPTDLLAQSLWAAVHGNVAIVYNLSRFDFRPAHELVETALDLALTQFGEVGNQVL